MKSFGLGIPLIFIFCIVGLAVPVAAEQNTTTDHIFKVKLQQMYM